MRGGSRAEDQAGPAGHVQGAVAGAGSGQRPGGQGHGRGGLARGQGGKQRRGSGRGEQLARQHGRQDRAGDERDGELLQGRGQVGQRAAGAAQDPGTAIENTPRPASSLR